MKEYVRVTLERFLRAAQLWIVIAGALALVLVQIPWLEGPLKKVGLQDNETFRTVIFTLLLASTFMQVRELSTRVTPSTSERQHFSDPYEMYQALLMRARTIPKPQDRCLDVLGLTLYSAWPTISFWLQRPESAGWTVRFATLSAHADKIGTWIPADWPAESASNVAAIRQFAQSKRAIGRGNQLEIIEYDFVPAVHGFRLGNGDVFVSNLLWQEDGKLGKPGFSYEFVPFTEAGPGAAAFRDLFENWFSRAQFADATQRA